MPRSRQTTGLPKCERAWERDAELTEQWAPPSCDKYTRTSSPDSSLNRRQPEAFTAPHIWFVASVFQPQISPRVLLDHQRDCLI
jgi:hypothetical protein